MKITLLTYKILNKFNEIAHFCTTRQGGISVGNYASNNLSPFSGDNPEHFFQNQKLLSNELGIETAQIIIPYQTHGTEIREINADYFKLNNQQKLQYLDGVDALFTQLTDVCIGVTTADCVPLLFYDPRTRVIAAAHAGWRGTCARIAEKTIDNMVENYGCSPADILVAIGPSISAQVYEVGEEVVESFRLAGFDIPEIVTVRNNASFLDLWKANQLLLESSGVLKDNIEVTGICTYSEHNNYFSARRLGIKSGRMLSGIMLKTKL